MIYFRFLPAGSVILKEEPSASQCKEDFYEEQCDKCLRKFKLRLIPCFYCSEVAFCSNNCRDIALGSRKLTSNIFLRNLFQEPTTNMSAIWQICSIQFYQVCQTRSILEIWLISADWHFGLSPKNLLSTTNLG